MDEYLLKDAEQQNYQLHKLLKYNIILLPLDD